MKISIEHMIDAGLGGKKNQDVYWAKQRDFGKKQAVLAMVCDGVGGVQEGEIASKKTIDYIVGGFWGNLPQYVEHRLSMEQLGRKLEKDLYKANIRLYEAAKKKGIRTGTTIALYFMLGKQYLILNVGDSRVYWNKEKGMYRTKDHTLYEEKDGKGDKQEKHMLWQSVGSQRELKIDQYSGIIMNGMDVLLLTDGAYRPFTKQEIREYCRCGNLKRMRRHAKKRKEPDNMTGVRIHIR
ncbi:MAG: PP2C family serine/threonine-protein phosphatase [Lachnospiraceae bacterium]|nr:PP2C family serine/threonine-protein phosphatase [Lachnospiraceae bacterium]